MPKEKSKKLALARPGDPLILADGVEVSPEPIPGEEPIPSQGLNAKTFKPTKKRTLKELPTSPQMVKAIACVFMYTALGVGDREIAIALTISPSELNTIRKHPGYKECFDCVLEEFISVHSNLLQARIAAFGHNAVENIMDIANTSKKDETKLRANIDLADRAGINSKQQSGKVTLNDLHITITKGDQSEVSVDISV